MQTFVDVQALKDPKERLTLGPPLTTMQLTVACLLPSELVSETGAETFYKVSPCLQRLVLQCPTRRWRIWLPKRACTSQGRPLFQLLTGSLLDVSPRRTSDGVTLVVSKSEIPPPGDVEVEDAAADARLSE